MEMRPHVDRPGRAGAVRLLLETGLAAAVLPEIVPADDAGRQRLERALAVLERLSHPGFPLALAALLDGLADAAGLPGRFAFAGGCRTRRRSGSPGWSSISAGLRGARAMRWSALQPLLVAEGIEDLLALDEAACAGRLGGGGLLPVAADAAAGGARSAAAGDGRRPAGPRRAGGPQVPLPLATNPRCPARRRHPHAGRGVALADRLLNNENRPQ